MKKILALALIVVLAFSMMTTTFAAKAEITGIDLDNLDFDVFEFEKDVIPGEVLYWHFGTYAQVGTVFTYSDGVTIADYDTDKEWDRLLDDVEFRVRVRSGSKVVDNVEWFCGTAVDSFTKDKHTDSVFIKLEIIDPFVSVDEVDVDIDIYMDIDNSRTDDNVYGCFTGELANEVTEVFSDSVEADAWEGQVIDAQEYVGKIAIIGNEEEDVIAHIKMANGKKIYFRVVTDGDIKDEPIMDKYPSIEWAYTVQSVGMSTYSGNIIELAGVDETYYVYGKAADGQLKYLGRGGEMLPYSAKYYVSSVKLDLDDEVVEEELPEEEEEVIGYNPSTGI